MMMFRNILLVVLALALVLFVLIQFIPYGRNHENPPVVAEPQWDSPQTRALVARTCFDCHSNQTVWPWYSNIAPVSWLVQRDVNEGRNDLNFSEWGSREQESDEILEVVLEGYMPPAQFLIMHPEARLSQAERSALVNGLRATFGGGESGED